jgi:carboxyl-terminal processing protease
MIERYVGRVLVLLLSSQLVSPLCFAQTLARSADGAAAALAGQGAGKSTNVFHPVVPGPMDGAIALVTARMLERYQYLRQPFNAAVSSKFLDRYIEMFDPQHLHFLQSDLADFENYRTNLDHLTLPERGTAPDAKPACVIFNRFVQRLEQRVNYADELLRNEPFNFDTDERVVLNRKDLPYPKDLVEAKKLWRERLRAEYLQEKLGKLDVKKTAAATAKSSERRFAPDSAADASISIPPVSSVATNAPDNAEPKKTDAEQIVETLSHRYHRNLHTFMDWDNDDVLQVYLTALAHVYDPHSDYFNRAQLDSFAIGMNLSLFGIGAELTSEDGYCTIHRLLPGGPAAKSNKIKENDRIIAVAQSNQPPVDVVDMSLSKAVQLIRGPKGTEVRLTMIPAGADSSARSILTLVRDEIKLEDQEAKAKIIEMPAPQGGNLRLGVIDLPSFYASFDPSNTRGKAEPRSTTEDVKRLVTKLKQENVAGIILDLRRNGGGSLEEAINLTGLFIKEGPVVQVRDYDGTVQEDDDRDPSVLYDGPLIVLTSRFSASASEILAGALQDYGRALIVGDSSTHGKGTVQSVQPLKDALLRMGVRGLTNDPGALKLTIKKFYRASGASTQLKGVVPDIVLPSVFNESKEIGEAALENPLPWDTIRGAKFDRLNLVEPYLPELRKRSSERVAGDKEYAYVREDIELFKKQQADKTVSLNEQVRLKEKEEADVRIKARDKERLARQEPAEKTFEISLKQAQLPGLPPPVAKTNSTMAKVSRVKSSTVAVTGTNGTVAAAKDGANDPANIDGEWDEDKPLTVDAALIESEHILVDYLSVLAKGNLVSAARMAPAPR